MPRPRPRAAALLAVVLLALPLLEGCGGAPAAASAPASAPSQPEDLSTAEGALTAVADAERAIDRIVGAAPGAGTMAPSVQASPAPPPPPPAPAAASAAPAAPEASPTEAAPQVSGGRMSAGDDYGRREKAPEACTTACRALASMERATEHLCALAGAGDARCTSARDRVKGASARVHAACPACGGG